MRKKKKQNQGKPGSKALRAIQAFFPKVMDVVDADDPLEIEVTDGDVRISERKDHRVCALAVACKRITHAHGVVIGLSVSYIINGATAVRYQNSQAISREITSFDRKAGFAAGYYRLTPAEPKRRLGVYKGTKTHPKLKGRKDRRKFRHYTTGVRTVIGQYMPPGMAR